MNGNTAPARRDMNSLLARVDGVRAQLAAYLPEGVKVDRFMALARRAVQSSRDSPSVHQAAYFGRYPTAHNQACH